MVLGVGALRNDAEGVVLHDAGTGDTCQETLLHATPEANDGDLGGWQLDVDGYFTYTEPWDEDPMRFVRIGF